MQLYMFTFHYEKVLRLCGNICRKNTHWAWLCRLFWSCTGPGLCFWHVENHYLSPPLEMTLKHTDSHSCCSKNGDKSSLKTFHYTISPQKYKLLCIFSTGQCLPVEIIRAQVMLGNLKPQWYNCPLGEMHLSCSTLEFPYDYLLIMCLY